MADLTVKDNVFTRVHLQSFIQCIHPDNTKYSWNILMKYECSYLQNIRIFGYSMNVNTIFQLEIRIIIIKEDILRIFARFIYFSCAMY